MATINIATNNGDIGGGEVMLFNIARAARSLGHRVIIVAPASPNEVAEAAQDEGFDTVVLPVSSRTQYMVALRVWDAHQRTGLLWCNGLVPAAATSGHKNRIVHLHQLPRTSTQKMLIGPARRGAVATLLPSEFSAERFKDTEVFYNWVEENRAPIPTPTPGAPVRVGFVGRPSVDKGTDVLASSIEMLNDARRRDDFGLASYQLVVAGEPKFVEEQASQSLSARLEQLGESVKTLGWVSPEVFVQQVDMVIVPSVIDETFGLVAAEAMSAHIPVIVSDAGALPEVVGDAHPWIARRADPRHLAELIEQVAEELVTSSPLLEASVEASYERWKKYFSPAAGRERVRNLLERIS